MRYMGGTSDWKGLEPSLAKFMLNLSHSDWKAEVSVEGHRRCYQEQKFWKFKTAQSWDLGYALTLLKLCPRKLWTDQFKISYYCLKLTICNSDSTHTPPGERWHRKNLDQGNQTQLFQSKKKFYFFTLWAKNYYFVSKVSVINSKGPIGDVYSVWRASRPMWSSTNSLVNFAWPFPKNPGCS